MDLQAVERFAHLKHNRNMIAFHLARTTLSRGTGALMLTFSLLSTTAAAKDVALISNKNNSLPPIALTDLEKMCKAQMSSWQDRKPDTISIRHPRPADLK